MSISQILPTAMKEAYHYPVMYREVLELLDINPVKENFSNGAKTKRVIVDCTVGIGSHAFRLLSQANDIFLIGIDRDQESLKLAKERLARFEGRFILIKNNFANLDRILEKLGIEEVDVLLFDLGISTYQLRNSVRGFSFLKEGPLDMRMDKDSFLSAYDLVNNLSEVELGNIFKKFGEERYSRRIAHFLVESRKNEQISTTVQLARMIINCIPGKARLERIHPATRIFQALRIAVNRELEALNSVLIQAISHLKTGGKMGVISFHSLEDRIVKHTYKDCFSKGILKIITKKPLTPTQEEKDENPPSSSAKLRVAEKV